MKTGKLLYKSEKYGYINEHGFHIYHRLDGPASIDFDCDENSISEQYFIHDKALTEKDFNTHPEVIAYRNEMKLKEKLGLE